MIGRRASRTLPVAGLIGLALGCAAPQPARGPATTEAPAAAPLVLPLGEWTGIGRYCLVENGRASCRERV